MDPADIEDLFDQLEDFSDSGPDVDNISIGSTPKPHLKPFFTSSRNLLNNEDAASRVNSANASSIVATIGGEQQSQSEWHLNFIWLFFIFLRYFRIFVRT